MLSLPLLSSSLTSVAVEGALAVPLSLVVCALHLPTQLTHLSLQQPPDKWSFVPGMVGCLHKLSEHTAPRFCFCCSALMVCYLRDTHSPDLPCTVHTNWDSYQLAHLQPFGSKGSWGSASFLALQFPWDESLMEEIVNKKHLGDSKSNGFADLHDVVNILRWGGLPGLQGE